MSAAMFHHILDRLAAEGYLFPHDGSLYLTLQGAAAIGCENVSMSRIPSVEGFVEFAGRDCDPTGMPVPYRKYWITSSPGPKPDSGIVTITPVTRATPLLDVWALVVSKGGPEAAFLDAVRRLAALNQGLVPRILDR